MSTGENLSTTITDQQLVLTAARLLNAMELGPTDEIRLAVLKRLAIQLGKNGYPVFLKLLLVIADSPHEKGCNTLAGALLLGLNRSDIPSGELTAWGAGAAASLNKPFSASVFSNLSSPKRSFGPVEYLTVWYCQKTQYPYLTEATFNQSLMSLLRLFRFNEKAYVLYPAKILADLESLPEGAYTGRTRRVLYALSNSWIQSSCPETVVTAALAN